MKNSIHTFDAAMRLAIILLPFLTMTSCNTTKDIQRESISEEVQKTESENTKTTAEAAIITDTKVTSETTVTEIFDTLVSVQPIVNGILVDKPISIPLKGTRIIQRKEFTDQKQTSQEKGVVVTSRKDEIMKKSDVKKTEREVERGGFSWWWVLVIILVFAGWRVWVWGRNKVF